MNGFVGYFKAEPTEYARMTVNGKVKKEGIGIAGIYLPLNTSIELVPVTSLDQPLLFKEVSSDHQEITVQGGFIYRVIEPGRLFARYNFSIEPRTKSYIGEGDEKVKGHLLHAIHGSSRNIVHQTKLEDILFMNEMLAADVTDQMRQGNYFADLGVSLEMVYISSIRPQPEIAKSLETPFREGLQKKADEAIHSRRALAVESERAIRQNEVATQIELEQRRRELVELEGSNTLQQADYRAQAARKELEVYAGMSPSELTAHALLELGRNAGKIGTLTITPELLAGVLNPK